MRRRKFPDTFFVLSIAAALIAGLLAWRQGFDADKTSLLTMSIEGTLAQIRTDFAAARDYSFLSTVYDSRRKNPWGNFTVRASAYNGGAGASHVQIRLTQIPDKVCENLLKTLGADRFFIHVIEDADDIVNWSAAISVSARNCQSFANQAKNAVQLIWMKSKVHGSK